MHCLVWVFFRFFCCCFLHATDAVSLWFTDEQEAVQKRTFTKWINSHLAKVREPVSTPTANCQPLYCPWTQTQAPGFVGDGKLPRPAASSCVAPPCLMWLGSQKTLPSWSWDWLCQLRPRTRSFFLTCLSYPPPSLILSGLIACSKDLLWLQLLHSHYCIVWYISVFFIPPAGHCL